MASRSEASVANNVFRVQTVSDIGNDRVAATLSDYDPSTGMAPGGGGTSTLTLNLARAEAEAGGFYPGNSFNVALTRA